MADQYACKLCHSVVSKILVGDVKDWEYGAPGKYSYHQCVSCEQIQIHPFPDMEQLKGAYPDTYPAYINNVKHTRGKFYDLLLTIHTRLRLRCLRQYLKPGIKILDVGSGNGDFLCCFKKYGITDLYGTDFSKQAVQIMQEKGINAFYGLYMDYAAANESFDMITMNHYIEHVLNPVAELEKSYDLLKPGGVLFGILPNFNGLDQVLFKKFWGGNHVPRHTFQYTDKQLEKLLKNAGFKKIKITHDINPGHIAISIQNWLQRNVKDLKNNSNITNGRMKYFNFLLLLTLPLNSLFSLLKRSGTIGFIATKMETNKWPKILKKLTPQQESISNNFMKYWHEVLGNGGFAYRLIEKFNHEYAVKNAPSAFLKTIEIGAGLGEHLRYETLSFEQEKNYVALELRENMAEQIKLNFPQIQTCIGDCQEPLPFPEGYFDRILAIHVLEHLPNLPATIKEMYRLCNKKSGSFSVVIPCEGGAIYTLARKISAQRIFERRYQQSYRWFIEREHINRPDEIIQELKRYFHIKHRRFFPFLVPLTDCNLCIGMTLYPRSG